MQLQQKENLLHVCFKDVNWIQMFGLHQFNVMDYFSLSQFYDRTCNNEVVKMQTQFNQTLQNVTLDQLVGIEYSLVHVQEPVLYVIRKQKRSSPSLVEPLETFYILEGTIFQAPSLYQLFSSRFQMMIYYLEKSLQKVNEVSEFSSLTGYQWLNKDEKETLQEANQEISPFLAQRLEAKIQKLLSSEQQ